RGTVRRRGAQRGHRGRAGRQGARLRPGRPAHRGPGAWTRRREHPRRLRLGRCDRARGGRPARGHGRQRLLGRRAAAAPVRPGDRRPDRDGVAGARTGRRGGPGATGPGGRPMTADGPDLLVAGAGGGLAGALRAAQLGLSVLVVEASEHFVRGNNTAMSTAMVPGAGTRWQAEAGIEDSAAMFLEDIMRKTEGEADATLAHALAGVSGRLVTWLADDLGLPISLVTDFPYPGHSRLRCHTVPGRSGARLLGGLVDRVRADER